MNTSLKIVLIVTAVLFAVAVLVMGGVLLGRNLLFRDNFSNRSFSPWSDSQPGINSQPFRMFPGGMGRMFSNPAQRSGRFFNRQPGSMHNRFNFADSTPTQPMSMDEARQVFESYLEELDLKDLYVHEVMLFEENAYAIIAESDSGMGAMELLADHASGTVFPEYGPNRMWNLKYGMMGSGRGGLGCATGLVQTPVASQDLSMPISLQEAREIVQTYLDENLPGTTASEGFSFYGYYSFDYEEDEAPVGMLSVNGTSGAIWLHNWHGTFLEEWEAE